MADDEELTLPQFRVDFTRVITYTSIVRAPSATDAGTLVGDIIRADESSRAPRVIQSGSDAVLVQDEGLGELSVKHVPRTEPWPAPSALPVLADPNLPPGPEGE